ncbi:MAG TPA: MFS transporter [Terriglobales bacterium]
MISTKFGNARVARAARSVNQRTITFDAAVVWEDTCGDRSNSAGFNGAKKRVVLIARAGWRRRRGAGRATSHALDPVHCWKLKECRSKEPAEVPTAHRRPYSGAILSFSNRFYEIRTGFERPFWVANISELFERLSYYAAFASLPRYLHESLHFGVERATSLAGLFGGLVWFLAAFGGALADRMGFRRALSLAYLILAVSYFLLGSIGSPWLAPVRDAMPLVVLVTLILMLPALGIALVKPSVVGTTARASKESVRSIGYSIYYTVVNIGGAAGPFLAGWVHQHFSVEKVFDMAAVSVFAMFFAVLLLFKEPRRSGEAHAESLGQVAKDFLTIASNWRFMLFLVIFSGYYIAFWQEFIILPLYIHNYVNANSNTEMLLMCDSLTVIALQMAVSILTQKMQPFRGIILGTLISGLAWVLLIVHPSVTMAVATLIVVAIGEIMQQPRYYEYISRLAPSGQQGTFMGFAFLPIGIGSLLGGWLGGFLIHHFGEVLHQPGLIWWPVTGVGVATAGVLWVYDRFVRLNTVGSK